MKKDKKKAVFLYICVFISILLVNVIAQKTYAKYRKKAEADVKLNISSWNIKINNEDIFGKRVLTGIIKPTIEKNPYVKDGIFAPGTKGYCDINIDSSTVDLPYILSISIPQDENNKIPDLKIKEYAINPSATNTERIQNDTNKLNLTINKNNPKNTIRMYIEWNDDETNIMNNEDDTKAGADGNKNSTIKIKIEFKQQNK